MQFTEIYKAFLLATSLVGVDSGLVPTVANNVFEDNISSYEITVPQLAKRSNWGLLAENQDAALIISAMYYWQKAVLVNCRNGGGRAGTCYASLGGMAVASAVALVKAGQSSGTTQKSKRDESEAASIRVEDYIDYFNTLGYNLTAHESTLKKRETGSDDNSIALSGYMANNSTDWETHPVYLQIGSHGNTVAVGDIDMTVNSLMSTYGESNFSSTNSTLVKRDHGYWVSYDFETSDSTYANAWLDDWNNLNHRFDGDYLVEKLYLWMNAYEYPKYCLSAQKGGKPDNYNSIGYQNICKGELYLEAWGGEDNECADSKDGADIT